MGYDNQADEFGPLMEPVARAILGEPNKSLSRPDELRFGNKGAISVIPSRGIFYDNHDGHGGGVLQFLQEQSFMSKTEALDYLRQFGLATKEDRAVQSNGHDKKPARKIDRTYDYVDEDGELLFQVIRYAEGEPRFMQRRPDPVDPHKWIWSTKDVRKIPYRLPELQEALAHERPVWVVEGEKDVDNLLKLGIAATCNPGGAGKWFDPCSAALKGAHVILCPDNDEAGRKHVERVGLALADIAASIRIVTLPGLKEKGDVSDWIADHPDNPADALWREVEYRSKDINEQKRESKYGAIPFADIDKLDQPSDYVIKGVLPRGALAILYGDSQAGKSFLTIDMALHVAMGAEWFGSRVHRGGVIYQAGEGQMGILKRFRAARDHLKAARDLPIVILPKQVDLWTAAGDTAPLIAEIKQQAETLSAPLELIVIDTHATASAGADENSAKDMTLVMQHYKQIQEETGATVLIVHHRNAAGEKMRGHTSLPAGVDASIEVTVDDVSRIREWRTKKQKDGPNNKHANFDLMQVRTGIDQDGDPITSCIISPIKPEDAPAQTTSQKAAPKLPDNAKIALRSLQVELAKSAKTPPPGVQLPPHAPYVATIGGWRSRFFRDRYSEDTPASTKHSGFDDSLKKLLVLNLIERRDEFVWTTKSGDRYR